MTWFRVDDGLHSHRKAVRAGVAAMGLWLLAGSWASDQLTDGWVPDYIAARLDHDYEDHAARLVRAGLWVAGEQDGDTGWWFHQWDEHQPSAESINAKREEAKERMRRLREARTAARAKREEQEIAKLEAESAATYTSKVNCSQDVRANTSRTSREVRSARPDPTRPDPTVVPTELPTYAPAGLPLDFDATSDHEGRQAMRSYDHNSDPDFAKFWSVVPEKSGKPSAYAAWKNALKKRDVTPQMLIERMATYAEWIKRTNGRPKYPQGWLNDERWNDASATGRSIQAKQQSPAAFTPYLNPVDDSAYDDWQFTDPEDL